VGKDIFFYSITIDPKHDTPEVMKAYAEQYHAGPGWQFLTGKAEDIELISKKLGLYTAPNPANQDGHIPSLLIGDEPTGQWMSNSALDNPRFLAMQIGDLLNTWKNRREMPSYADVPSMGNADSGKYHFSTKCAACHTIGKGDSVGPDLLGVTNFRNREWLAHYIQAPNELLAAKDSIAVALFAKYKQVRMPNLRLGGEEVSAIIGYLESESAAYLRTVSSGSRKVLYYVDPMHRSYKSNKPGTAPDCGMKLEPVYADDVPAVAAR
jgi:protein SCO1